MDEARPAHLPYLKLPDSPYRVPVGGSFRVTDAPTAPPPEAPDRKSAKRELRSLVRELSDFQRVLYAQNTYAVLCIFQAMDAAGKDSTIRAVTSGIDPTGFQVFAFKAPSEEELDHDFLWRTSRRLPERGRIGIFNRSYYEEVLVVRVHPRYLERQHLPHPLELDRLWEDRFESIRAHERHLAANGTVVLKFWLNLSKDEQRRRFLDRIDVRRKNWKFRLDDVAERRHWDEYMTAYEAALAATSRPWAPWYAIPADDKPFMRLQVAKILRDTFHRMDLRYPDITPDVQEELGAIRRFLERDT